MSVISSICVALSTQTISRIYVSEISGIILVSWSLLCSCELFICALKKGIVGGDFMFKMEILFPSRFNEKNTKRGIVFHVVSEVTGDPIQHCVSYNDG